MGLFELRLREKGKKAFVAAVAVDDDDFLAAVAGHFVGGFLEKFELEFAAVSDGAGFVFGFEDLAEEILREDDSVFLFGGVQRGVADVEQVRAEREMRAVLFENAEGEQASALGLGDGGAKIGGGEFFPTDGEFGLRTSGNGAQEKGGECKDATEHLEVLRVLAHSSAKKSKAHY